MKKLFPVFVLFLLILVPFRVFACPQCEDPSSLSYHYRTVCNGSPYLNYSASLMLDTVSAPIYDIHVVCNGTDYLLFLSSGPFSGKTGATWGKGDDATGSGGSSPFSNVRYRLIQLKSGPGAMYDYHFDGWYSYPGSYFPNNYLELDSVSESSILAIDTSGMTPVISSDGSIYQPPSYDSVSYDFTQDLYNPEYPLPELYDLSYDSFSIHNPNGYAFDLVVQTVFYGTKMQKYTEGGNHYITDKLRKFAKHEYNFTLSDPLSITGLVNIKDIYSVDLLETFKKDWIDWSNLYPTLDTIPGYSWINSIGYTARNYLNYRVYNEELVNERGLLVSLDLTNCCEVKYFVRFRDDSGYGQWMVYTVSGTDSDGVAAEVGEAGKPAYIVTGAVSGSTASGVPIITDPVTQRFDPINEQYDVVLNDGSEINWNYSVENFQSAFSFFGEMPNFVSAVFSCYPAWMVEIIGATITFLCALAIYHGIRG